MNWLEQPQQIDAQGRLGPIKDGLCVPYAENVFIERFKKDTGQTIVQTILDGVSIPHWYYRSEQWLDQPYLICTTSVIQPYRGPVNLAYPWLYGPGTFRVDEIETQLAIEKAQIALKQ